MQSRQLVPAYFGVGHALNAFIESNPGGLALLKTMARSFPPFLDIIRNVEMALAKEADFGIARLYASLVSEDGGSLRTRVFTTSSKPSSTPRHPLHAPSRSPASSACSRPTQSSSAPASASATPTSTPCPSSRSS